jgi:RNA polymerase sigma-70 factor, ECF subfamily
LLYVCFAAAPSSAFRDNQGSPFRPVDRQGNVKPGGAGPGELLAGLYERHSSRVFGYCLNWLRSREEAEDALQTTFLYAFRGLRRGIVPVREIPWLLAIARTVCLSRADAARRRAPEIPHDPVALAESVAAPMPSAELDGLAAALAGLTEQQRQAIVMREWHGLSYREIAQTLGISQAAVETRLFRARRTLTRRLQRPLGTAGSFLPWIRSLACGGASKLAAGATIIAVSATAGTLLRTTQMHHHAPSRQTRPPTHAIAQPNDTALPSPRRAHNPTVQLARHPATTRTSAKAAPNHSPSPPTANPPGNPNTQALPSPPQPNPRTIDKTPAPVSATPLAPRPAVDWLEKGAPTVVSGATSTAANAATTASKTADGATGAVAQTAATVINTATTLSNPATTPTTATTTPPTTTPNIATVLAGTSTIATPPTIP